MKKIYFILTILYPFISIAQLPAVKWELSSTKKEGSRYELVSKISLPRGWHTYMMSDTAIGLEALSLSCNDENITKDKSQVINGSVTDFKDPLFDNEIVKIASGDFIVVETIKIKKIIPAFVRVTLKGFISDNKQFLPIEETKEVKLEGGVAAIIDTALKRPEIVLKEPAFPCGDTIIEGASYLTIFLKGFTGGLIALLMPCLFPMIPVTVSFFTNRSGNRKKAIRNALIYGMSILTIYLLASIPFHLLKGVDSQIFNTISTNPWVNVLFFVIFILFALSLFGLFELKLPAAFSNKAGSKSNITSLSGIFFMALTLVVVSFSCTGPILGALLVGALTGPWELTIGMAGFGLALALPFTFFAMFPQWLKSLPKSGVWLDVVKKSLAFVELALAIKFLSNADLIQQWGILKREIFIGSWIIIAACLSFYLLGIFGERKKSHLYVAGTEQKQQLPWGRLFFGLVALTFALYLIPGITDKKTSNLNLLSGLAPPLSYSIYGAGNIEGKAVRPNAKNDYAAALQMAKEQNKPLLIDFTGVVCVNCRKMEELVWTVPGIKKTIEEDFILVSLYVDARESIPAANQFTYNGKEIKTIGNKWAMFQKVNFESASQPMYAVVSPEEKLMTRPVGSKDADDYKEWLDCGLAAFKNQKK